MKGVSVFPFSPFLYFSLRFPRGRYLLSLYLSVYISSFVTAQSTTTTGRMETIPLHFFLPRFVKTEQEKITLHCLLISTG